MLECLSHSPANFYVYSRFSAERQTMLWPRGFTAVTREPQTRRVIIVHVGRQPSLPTKFCRKMRCVLIPVSWTFLRSSYYLIYCDHTGCCCSNLCTYYSTYVPLLSDLFMHFFAQFVIRTSTSNFSNLSLTHKLKSLLHRNIL
jgi:hypothetical protein